MKENLINVLPDYYYKKNIFVVASIRQMVSLISPSKDPFPMLSIELEYILGTDGPEDPIRSVKVIAGGRNLLAKIHGFEISSLI